MLTPYDAWLSWILPIVGGALLLRAVRLSNSAKASLALCFLGAASIFSATMIPDALGGAPIDLRLASPFSFLGVMLDPLSVVTTLTINVVGFLVMLFSTAYMRGEPALNRFYFITMVFIGGLSLIAMADNLLLLAIGWETTGLCTALLANFWYQRPERARVSLKTILTLRVGDVFLMISILMIFSASSTFNYIELAARPEWARTLSAAGMLLPAFLMLFFSCIVKAAQFPIHEWLPWALQASPSSFNAIVECIAGVYMIARVIPILHSLYAAGFSELKVLFEIIALTGAFSGLAGALLALTERNIERCLAYSITNQYGFVVTGLGVSALLSHLSEAYLISVAYLLVDAVASALLFLVAAAVIYRIGTENLPEMKISRGMMPVTYICLLIGVIELFGIPPLTGFWVEEGVSTAILELTHTSHAQFGYAIYAVFFTAAVVTCMYGVRLLALVFDLRSPMPRRIAKVARHEAPLEMLIPMMLFAAALPIGGLLIPFGIDEFYNFLGPVIAHPPFLKRPTEVLESAFLSRGFALSVLAYTGIALGYIIYVRGIIRPSELEKSVVFRLLDRAGADGLYFNALYNRLGLIVVSGSRFLYRTVEMLEAELTHLRRLAEAFDYIVIVVFYLAHRLNGIVEARLDGLNNQVASGVARLGSLVRRMQSGVFSINMLLVSIALALVMLIIVTYV